jgi:hypothetical protein
MSFFEPFMCPVPPQIAGVVGTATGAVVPVTVTPVSTGAFKKRKLQRRWLPMVKRYLEMKVVFAQWRGNLK